MMRAPLPFRWALGLVPPRWRDSVRRDLLEEWAAQVLRDGVF